MPRPLRIEYAGAWYHVMNRGANHMNIFTTNEHRIFFLNLLKEISALFKIEIHSYCLMDNHYHLLVHTHHPNLSKAMRHLNSLYTLSYNRSLDRDGPLFRGRYKAILIEANEYLLKVSRYIHLNPVEANLIENPIHYKWSSYRNFVSENRYNWLHTRFILDNFGSKKSYAEFVTEGIDDKIRDFYKFPQAPAILGDTQFVIEKLKILNDDYKFETQTDINRIKKLLSIDKITDCVAQYFDASVCELKIPRRKNNLPRMLAIYLARQYTQASHKKLAEYFTGIKRFSVSSAIIRCKNWIESDLTIMTHYVKLKEMIEG